MNYNSTRDNKNVVTAADAIRLGLAADGGLFVPGELPQVSLERLGGMIGMTYEQRASAIMRLFLPEYTVSELADFCVRAYGPEHFDTREVAPLRYVEPGRYQLELWHGPTCAFKDMALQILPYLLTSAMKKCGETRQVCILVATSGDTGKAALEGFADVPGTKIQVFYPRDGVSAVQKLQMTSQRGSNVSVCGVEGNFDDAQAGVKRIFSDEALRQTLSERGWLLSSANSINWGRLLPQIVYYFSAYCRLAELGEISRGDPIDFCVPTGNFGDILAGWYAREMGLPVRHLLCASNQNDVLTEFLETGVYDRNRPFYTTISPSMDILVSSNLERLLYHLSGGCDDETAGYMESLAKTGRYVVSPALKEKIQSVFLCGSCDDTATKAEIRRVFRETGCLMDPHTAVASAVHRRLAKEDGVPAVIVSTASPFKFCGAVLDALEISHGEDGVGLIDELERASGKIAPMPLKALRDKTARFKDSVEPAGMRSFTEAFLR